MKTIQAEADQIVDRALEGELAAAMRRKLNRLAKAQALAWNALGPEIQGVYLRTVDAMEAK
mgnify:CR=1 FL=1